MKHQLDFEKPILELQGKLDELREHPEKHSLGVSFEEEIQLIERKLAETRRHIFLNLTPWQRVQLARHPKRPHSLDYIERVFTDFREIHGDRLFADDPAIVCGSAFLNGRPLMVVGEQKGRDTKQKLHRNFGMPKPEGYRKALRVMQLAAKFGRAVVTLLDTPGAYPGIDAEERGQAEAIARNLREMARLAVPVITICIGEGGSGGALALGVGNRVLMLENAIYSVISPESCAAIIWRDSTKAELAAAALRLTAEELLKLGLIDSVVAEPPGGRKYSRLFGTSPPISTVTVTNCGASMALGSATVTSPV